MTPAGSGEAGARVGVTNQPREKPVGAPALDAASAPPALVVDHLTKRFGERVAFDDVSFSVAYGEVFGFLGRTVPGRQPR